MDLLFKEYCNRLSPILVIEIAAWIGLNIVAARLYDQVAENRAALISHSVPTGGSVLGDTNKNLAHDILFALSGQVQTKINFYY